MLPAGDGALPPGVEAERAQAAADTSQTASDSDITEGAVDGTCER